MVIICFPCIIRTTTIGAGKSWKINCVRKEELWYFYYTLLNMVTYVLILLCWLYVSLYNTHPWNLEWKIWENRPSLKKRTISLLVILCLIWWRISSPHNVDYMSLLNNMHPENLGWKVLENRPSSKRRITVLLVILRYVCSSQKVDYMFLVYNIHT